MKDKLDGNTPSLETEAKLAAFIAGFWGDPYGFVLAAWPWGQPTLPDGTFNPLHDKTGPEPWQKEELIKLGEHIRGNALMKDLGLEQFVYKFAAASGHDVGKSAYVSWLIYFFMSTRVDTRGVVTASTQFQLEDKTWPELQKWHNMAINRHWFKWMATTFSFAAYSEERQKNYRFTAATVSETNTEAFQGLHNEGRTVVVLFDEASGVMSKIWEIVEGILMENAECFFFALGNPTKPDGEFADCFGKHQHLYRTRHIDSREVSLTNKSAIRELIQKYGGEDNDVIKIRVRGEFPTVSYDGFMNAEAVRDCMDRETVIIDPNAPLYMTVDVANQGGDEIVIGWRQGWDARSRPKRTFRNLKHGELVKQVQDAVYWSQPDIVIVECVGIGIPLCDDLEDLGIKVFRAYPGAIIRDNHYVNNRGLWWSKARDWIYEPLSALEDDAEQFDQFTKIQYFLRRSDGRTLIESKADMRKRNLPSPDRADMLVLSFAVELPRRNLHFAKNSVQRSQTAKLQDDPIEA